MYGVKEEVGELVLVVKKLGEEVVKAELCKVEESKMDIMEEQLVKVKVVK